MNNNTAIMCFGELLLRLGAPGHERLLQSPRLDVHIGGAEANVAVALSHFGQNVAMISVVADNALGAAAIGELRRHKVDTARVAIGAGRMGLYFLETGALHRASEVLYDRAESAFARALPESFAWARLLDGAGMLHVSGVTPAVGANAAAATLQAVEAAHERGLRISFDGNFRSKLWQAWPGDAASILHHIFARANLVFADHRDIGIVLKQDFSLAPHPDESAAAAAFEAFPGIARIAMTKRRQHSVDHHELSARLYTRDAVIDTETCNMLPIVDRIGAGDAFAAGLLHGLCSDMSDGEALNFALAAACLKHSVPGDMLCMTADRVAALVAERCFDVRR